MHARGLSRGRRRAQGVRIKLIDFGLAMRVFCPVPGPSVVGSACYMARAAPPSFRLPCFGNNSFPECPATATGRKPSKLNTHKAPVLMFA
eukprot:1432569-Pleurochrysis_carterae.AAC.1